MSDEQAQARPFAGWLIEQRAGVTHAELTEAMAQVVAAVLEHGKVGELRLSLKVKRVGERMVEVADTIVVKVPQGEREGSLFFTDLAAGLHRNDPRQPELPLREVPRPDIKEASS